MSDVVAAATRAAATRMLRRTAERPVADARRQPTVEEPGARLAALLQILEVRLQPLVELGGGDAQAFGPQVVEQHQSLAEEIQSAASAAAVEVQVHAAGDHHQRAYQRLIVAADRVEDALEAFLRGEVVAPVVAIDGLLELLALRRVHTDAIQSLRCGSEAPALQSQLKRHTGRSSR